MPLLPFRKTNELWYLDMPELLEPYMLGRAPLVMAEVGIETFLNTIRKDYQDYFVLDFSLECREEYDARLELQNLELSEKDIASFEFEDFGNFYKCTMKNGIVLDRLVCLPIIIKKLFDNHAKSIFYVSLVGS